MKHCRFLRVFVMLGLPLLFLVGGILGLSATSGWMPMVGASNSYVSTNVALMGGQLSASTPMWLVERVDKPKYFAPMGNRSMALDSTGHPHQVYGGDFLYYAHYDDPGLGLDQSWRIETVDDVGPVGNGAALALDAHDRPHIAYCGREPGGQGCATLKYAHYDGVAWHIGTVDNGPLGEGHLAIVVDPSSWAHISYDSVNYLRYAHFDGVGWQVETVDNSSAVGWYTFLALDAGGRPHISYCQHDAYECTALKYAYYDGATWQIETVDGVDDAGGYSSLALDAGGRPHISYYNRTVDNHELGYAYYDGTTWQIETVAEKTAVSFLANHCESCTCVVQPTRLAVARHYLAGQPVGALMRRCISETIILPKSVV